MSSFSFDHTGFRIDGEDQFMISGEFHYFRVPRSDWRRRMRLFLEAGGNCIATYVPWLIHEPVEGDIRFGDVDNRDLITFLKIAQEEGLKVVLRPGPYQYSELVNNGIPEWLTQTYPETLARNVAGESFNPGGISYLHPVVLEKARIYYRAFAELVRPFMAENGGPVCMLQVDNEMPGVHVWFGSMDYNPDTMGFGKKDGRYPLWLKEKYMSIDQLNTAYHTNYTAFEQVQPIQTAVLTDIYSCRRHKDYSDFYRSTLAEYACLLTSWLREDGLGGPICHNSANPESNCQFPEVVSSMENLFGDSSFLLGSDHYYTLDSSWPQNNPTPQYALRVLKSCDTMRSMGMPPSVLEMPGGSPSDTPPILPADLLACYMTNLALGMKGVNYYIYTGGPNFPETGETAEIYDYNAHVRADGSLNDTYYILKQFNEFMNQHKWMQRGKRVASVQVGFEWNTLRCDEYDYAGLPCGGALAGRFIENGILYTLMCSCYSPELVLLTGDLDLTRPLIIPSPSVMSEEAQKTVISFLQRGGHVMVLPVFPEMNEDYQQVNLFSELLGPMKFRYNQPVRTAVEVNGAGRVYGIRKATFCDILPAGAEILATDAASGAVTGFQCTVGTGKLLWFGGYWNMKTFDQARMMEHFVNLMGGKPVVSSSNRNIFTSLWIGEGGQRLLFVMNLYSSSQTTDIIISGSSDTAPVTLKEITLSPMEVRTYEA